jgi:nitrate reductase delta subunit
VVNVYVTLRLYQLFASLVEYPTPFLMDRVNECISLLTPLQHEAADLLGRFKTFLTLTPLSRMEEVYTATFDLDAVCYPYVGYHLFGDGNHRGMFLAGLKEHYQGSGFSAGNDLPDHLGVMLRFLAHSNDEGDREELLFLCIIPALKSMLDGFEDSANAYKGVLQALLLVLQSNTQPEEVGTFPKIASEGFRYDR